MTINEHGQLIGRESERSQLTRHSPNTNSELSLAEVAQGLVATLVHELGSQSSIIERLERVEEVVLRMERVLEAIRAAGESEARKKESYSTVEVAELLGKRPFTVREWCRLGRIRAVKTHAGRGSEPEWRVTNDELVRIQNEGLLPRSSRFR